MPPAKAAAANDPPRLGQLDPRRTRGRPPCQRTPAQRCHRPAAVHRSRHRQSAPVPDLCQARHHHPRRTGRTGSLTGSDRQMIWRVRHALAFAPPHPVAPKMIRRRPEETICMPPPRQPAWQSSRADSAGRMWVRPSGPAYTILRRCGRRVGGLGPGLTCESADALSGCPANDSSAGSQVYLAPTGGAVPICPSCARGRGSQARRPAGACHPSTTEKGWP